MAEQVVRDANSDGFETVVVRPRLVWGAGDTTILPALVSAVEKKRFSWIGGGGHRTSTTHVDNVIEGLMLGAERGRPGGVYFVTDGEPVVFREFVTELLGTQGVTPPERNTPAPVGAHRGRGLGGRVAPAAPAGQPAGHAPRILALGAGVHDRHLPRPRGAGLRAGALPGGGHGGAAARARRLSPAPP